MAHHVPRFYGASFHKRGENWPHLSAELGLNGNDTIAYFDVSSKGGETTGREELSTSGDCPNGRYADRDSSGSYLVKILFTVGKKGCAPFGCSEGGAFFVSYWDSLSTRKALSVQWGEDKFWLEILSIWTYGFQLKARALNPREPRRIPLRHALPCLAASWAAAPRLTAIRSP